jgi:hypothetical protein
MSGTQAVPPTDRLPITIAIKGIGCIEGASDVSSEVRVAEPLVLVVAADLTAMPRPSVRATRYGPWGDVETGDTRSTRIIPPDLPPAAVDALANFAVLRRPFWGLDNRSARLIDRPGDVVILIALLDRDEGATGATRERAQAAAANELANSVGLDRSSRVERMIAGVSGALDLPPRTPDAPDHFGDVQELALTPTDLVLPIVGPHARSLVVAGAGGRYRIDFEFLRG